MKLFFGGPSEPRETRDRWGGETADAAADAVLADIDALLKEQTVRDMATAAAELFSDGEWTSWTESLQALPAATIAYR